VAEELTVELDRTDWSPGETLTGRVRLSPELADAAGTLRVEVGWVSESGAAEQEQDQQPAEEGPADGDGRRFTFPLPPAPLSYEGVLMKLRWRVRAEVSVGRRKTSAEATFRLGRVAPVVPLSP
jgi:hypothetical protein